MASRGRLTTSDIEGLEEDDEPKKKKRRRPKMEWQLFVGGFGFPWSPRRRDAWLLIAIWATAAGWLTYSAIDLGIGRALGVASMYQTIVALLAALGALIAGVCCTGVATIHGLTILLETTAGNDRMQNWPNVGLFLDWVGDLWHIFNTAAVTVVLGLGLDWLLPGLLGRESRWSPSRSSSLPGPLALHLGVRLAVPARFGRVS